MLARSAVRIWSLLEKKLKLSWESSSFSLPCDFSATICLSTDLALFTNQMCRPTTATINTIARVKPNLNNFLYADRFLFSGMVKNYPIPIYRDGYVDFTKIVLNSYLEKCFKKNSFGMPCY